MNHACQLPVQCLFHTEAYSEAVHAIAARAYASGVCFMRLNESVPHAASSCRITAVMAGSGQGAPLLLCLCLLLLLLRLAGPDGQAPVGRAQCQECWFQGHGRCRGACLLTPTHSSNLTMFSGLQMRNYLTSVHGIRFSGASASQLAYVRKAGLYVRKAGPSGYNSVMGPSKMSVCVLLVTSCVAH